MMKIRWVDMIRNKDVAQIEERKKKTLSPSIIKREDILVGHILRHEPRRNT